MRIALATTALAVLILLLACSGPDSPEPNGEREPESGTGVLPGVRQSKSLAGIDVEEEAEGPWTVRSARRSESRNSGRGRATGGETLSASGPGAPPPTGSASGPSDGGPPVADAMDDADSAGRPDPRNQGGSPLKAGSTDDNLDYAEFLTFLAKWGDRPDTVEGYQMLDVADRRYIRVQDSKGRPVPAAMVTVADIEKDKVVMRATTYGDGRAPFYPHLLAEPGAFAASGNASLVVDVLFGAVRARVRWDGTADLTIPLSAERPVVDTVPLDILLLIDTTGSMDDEIGRIKASLLAMTGKLRSLEREFDLRYSAVLYRDIGDQYVTKAHPFTSDIEAFDAALQPIRADGGGDLPESLNQGLAEAVGRADWRDGAAKVMFLIADAPPHMDYEGDVPYGESLIAARAEGIRIHTVAASGLPPVGSLVFRQIAQFTRGKFIFIQYGTLADTAASHGVGGKTKGNNLDDILFEQIREEVARWGRDV